MRYLLLVLLLTACNLKPNPVAPAADSKELIKVCWNENAPVAQIPESCDKPESIVWKKGAPLTVYAHPLVYLKTLQAVKTWNDELGFEMLKLATFLPSPMSQADIFVVPGGPHPRWLGVTGWRKHPDTKGMQSIVVVFNGSGVDTYIHELGHALGLAHDPTDFRSIMYPNNSRPLPRIQTQDLAILRKLYGRNRKR